MVGGNSGETQKIYSLRLDRILNNCVGGSVMVKDSEHKWCKVANSLSTQCEGENIHSQCKNCTLV